MEKFCGKILRRECDHFAYVLAYYFDATGTVSTYCNDHLLLSDFLEGIKIYHENLVIFQIIKCHTKKIQSFI